MYCMFEWSGRSGNKQQRHHIQHNTCFQRNALLMSSVNRLFCCLIQFFFFFGLEAFLQSVLYSLLEHSHTLTHTHAHTVSWSLSGYFGGQLSFGSSAGPSSTSLPPLSFLCLRPSLLHVLSFTPLILVRLFSAFLKPLVSVRGYFCASSLSRFVWQKKKKKRKEKMFFLIGNKMTCWLF